jgi:hypothetical protein
MRLGSVCQLNEGETYQSKKPLVMSQELCFGRCGRLIGDRLMSHPALESAIALNQTQGATILIWLAPIRVTVLEL